MLVDTTMHQNKNWFIRNLNNNAPDNTEFAMVSK